MDMTGEQLLPTTRDRVWAALMDPETLRRAIPGCESIADEGQGALRVAVLAAVGPVRARFKGRLQQQDLQAPSRYTLAFEGDGGMAGFARGSAEVELSDATVDGRAGTRLVYRASAQIGGRLAQIGSRLVDATAAKLSAQFFERFSQLLAEPSEAGRGVAATRTAAEALSVAALAGAPAATLPPPALMPAAARPAQADRADIGMVTLRMPAWTWTATVAVLGASFAWVATR